MSPRPTLDRSARRLAATCALAAASAGALAPAAHATNGEANKPVTWELSFVDSVSTRADDLRPDSVSFERSGGLGLTGQERPFLRLIRAGSVLDTESGGFGDGYGSLSRPELLAGDTLQVVDSVTGGLYAAATFDGRPTFDATTCSGSIKGTGTRTENSSITGVGEYANVKHPWRYSDDPTMTTTGVITNAAAGTFETTFKRALIPGHLLWAQTSLIQSPSVTVTSYSERIVAACPAPPIPPDTLAPAGAATPAAAVRKLKDFTKKGVTFRVSSTEAATVNASLTLQTKKVITKKGKKKSKTELVVVGKATTSIAAGASLDVNVKVDKAFAGKVKGAVGKKGSKLLLTTTLTDGAGNTATLPVTSVKFPKK
jgi:hypothetical protein